MDIINEYYEWLYQTILGKRYRRLIHELWDTEFFYTIELDDNRVGDGVDLRYKFASIANIPDRVMDKHLDKNTCSVLEVMVGLSIRMEESTLGDPDYGDRTAIWFWEMIKSLGLYEMTDVAYDQFYVQSTISSFLHRDYKSNGKGGLFTIRNTDLDARDIDIWHQMCIYSDNILGLL